MRKFVTLLGILSLLLVSFAGAALAQATPSVEVSDQDVQNDTVTIDSVVSDGPGWLVIHEADAAGNPGNVIGQTEVQAGENTDVSVTLDRPAEDGETLVAMLHEDTGTEGQYEFGQVEGADQPVTAEGGIVMTSFTVSVSGTTDGGTTDGGTTDGGTTDGGTTDGGTTDGGTTDGGTTDGGTTDDTTTDGTTTDGGTTDGDTTDGTTTDGTTTDDTTTDGGTTDGGTTDGTTTDGTTTEGDTTEGDTAEGDAATDEGGTTTDDGATAAGEGEAEPEGLPVTGADHTTPVWPLIVIAAGVALVVAAAGLRPRLR